MELSRRNFIALGAASSAALAIGALPVLAEPTRRMILTIWASDDDSDDPRNWRQVASHVLDPEASAVNIAFDQPVHARWFKHSITLEGYESDLPTYTIESSTDQKTWRGDPEWNSGGHWIRHVTSPLYPIREFVYKMNPVGRGIIGHISWMRWT